MARLEANFHHPSSQCHANATRNSLIVSECCNVALIALVLKIYVLMLGFLSEPIILHYFCCKR